MSAQFTHSQYAQRRRMDKGRELARWCYQRGIGPGVAAQEPAVLRLAARAAGVNPPHVDDQGHSWTWQLVAELLHARVAWDRAHGQPPPTHVPCIACAVLPAVCRQHQAAPAVCCSCRLPLDPALAAAGLHLHPMCEQPVRPPTPLANNN